MTCGTFHREQRADRSHIQFAVAALGGGLALSVSGAVSAADPALFQGKVLFEDDFNGTAGSLPDQTKWGDYSVETYNPSAAFGRIKEGNNETLDGNGNLQIPATPTVGSAIRTGEKFGFQYGVVSAWMKLPAESGYWAAFWTLNSPPNGAEQLPVGEIDILEGYTMWNNVYHAQGHSWTSGSSNYHSGDNRCPQPEAADLSGKFNKFTAKVEPGQITFYFNDVQCGRVHKKDPTKVWAFGPDVTRPNWLILNLAVGGAGGQQTPPSMPDKLLIDRVEVRELPPRP